MAKYIVDIANDNYMISFHGAGSCSFKKVTDLKPYTEPDEDEIRQRVENEVWEFAKQVSIMKPEDKRECWGTEKYNTINFGYSYQEAKAKYDAWKKKKEEIHVWDEG